MSFLRRFFPVFAVFVLAVGSLQAQTRDPSGAPARSQALFQKLGILGANTRLTRVVVLPPRDQPKIVGRQTQADSLVFSFEGFAADKQAILNNFLIANLQRMKLIYGDAARPGATVRVIGNGAFAAAYAPPAATNPQGGTIFYRYDDAASVAQNQYNFTRLVLRAFHGPKIFAFDFKNGVYVDSWESGFADAAALIIAYGAQNSPRNFDPNQLGPYTLPFYDFFNLPSLGNAYIFPPPDATYLPPGQTAAQPVPQLPISDFRAAMAQSAWLKVAIENPGFFSQFNQKYFAQWTPQLAADVPALQNIAASVVPTVEGLNFNDWARRQHVLNTNVEVGAKLFAIVQPLSNLRTGDTRSSFVGFAEAFTTRADGVEIPGVGFDTGTLAVFDENGRDVSDKSSELVASNIFGFTTAQTPGQTSFQIGFANLGTPDRARLSVKLRLGTLETTAYFPYNVAGTNAAETNPPAFFYGATVGRNSGTIQLSGAASQSNIAISRGVFASTATYPSGPRVQTTWNFGNVQRKRNTAWFVPNTDTRSVGFLFEVPPSGQTIPFQTSTRGDNKLRLVSVPLFPLESDEAAILNVAPDTLALAHYLPNLSPGTFSGGALKFGIGTDRHEIYPFISDPIEPGRGYWLRVNGSFSANIKGDEPNRDKAYEVPLIGGWNQVGVPFNRAFDPEALQVRFGGFAPVSFQKAIQYGWVAPGVWRWKATGGYARVDGQNTPMNPFEGYYIYSPQPRGTVLVFDVAERTTSTKTNNQTAPGWKIRLQAATDKTRDRDNFFGVSPLENGVPATRAAAKPPVGEISLTLHFASSGWPALDQSGMGAASGWADSFLPPIEGEGRWNFTVEGAAKGERVTLSWGDPERAPANLRLRLVDLKSGRITNLWSRRYTFQSDGEPRAFRIEAKRKGGTSVKEF